MGKIYVRFPTESAVIPVSLGRGADYCITQQQFSHMPLFNHIVTEKIDFVKNLNAFLEIALIIASWKSIKPTFLYNCCSIFIDQQSISDNKCNRFRIIHNFHSTFGRRWWKGKEKPLKFQISTLKHFNLRVVIKKKGGRVFFFFKLKYGNQGCCNVHKIIATYG